MDQQKQWPWLAPNTRSRLLPQSAKRPVVELPWSCRGAAERSESMIRPLPYLVLGAHLLAMRRTCDEMDVAVQQQWDVLLDGHWLSFKFCVMQVVFSKL